MVCSLKPAHYQHAVSAEHVRWDARHRGGAERAVRGAASWADWDWYLVGRLNTDLPPRPRHVQPRYNLTKAARVWSNVDVRGSFGLTGIAI